MKKDILAEFMNQQNKIFHFNCERNGGLDISTTILPQIPKGIRSEYWMKKVWKYKETQSERNSTKSRENNESSKNL